jgi:hypothetical protein
MTHKLISDTGVGTWDKACAYYNQLGLADYVIGMQYENMVTHVVFKVPDEKVPAVWRKLGKNMGDCPIQLNEQGKPK